MCIRDSSECWHFWTSELNLCKTFCHNYTGCIRLACLLYVLSNDSVNGSIEMMHSHTNCICLTFSTVRFKCFFKSPCREYASSNWLPEQMQLRTHCICLLFTTMCFEIALIFPALHVTTATLDWFVQVTWNITWRGSRQKRKYSVCFIPV